MSARGVAPRAPLFACLLSSMIARAHGGARRLHGHRRCARWFWRERSSDSHCVRPLDTRSDGTGTLARSTLSE